MIREKQNEELIERYLLGDLSQSEREQIESRYFTEPDFLERVDAVEEVLITDYVRGALSEERSQKLRDQLLTSSYQMEKVKFAETLLHSIEQISADDVTVAPFVPARESWWDAVREAFRFQRGLVVATAAVLVIIGGLVFEIIRLRQQLENARQEQTALRQREQDLQGTVAQQQEVIDQLTGQPLVPPPDKKDEPNKVGTPVPRTHFATFISPLLFTGARTAQGDLQELVISRDFEIVQLRLFYEGENRPPFRAVLENADREQLWPKDGLPPKYDLSASRFGKGKQVDVELPASLFDDRTYIVTLKARTSSGEEEDISHYTFNIRRK